MRVLVVSSLPPTRCGIAIYAAQQIQTLREQGHEVTTASLDGAGEADLHFRLKDPAEIGRLRALLPNYDRCLLHYQHDFFFDDLKKSTLLAHNLLLAALFAQGVEVVAHEVLYRLLDGSYGLWVGRLERLKWRSAKTVVVHTAAEAARLRALAPGATVVQREHGAEFKRFRQIDRLGARAELGIESASTVFLCIGFLQRSKGFDRAMRAFAANSDPHARLYVVGAARVETGDTRGYIDELAALAKADRRIKLIERFLTDAEFDTWIAASDAVVLPYREIWSSGVAARVRLNGRRLIAAAVGGLGDQLGSDDVLVSSDADLREALRRPNARHRSPGRSRPRIAVVAPWYAPARAGGAERVVRETAEHLAARGFSLEVFTTRVRDSAADWSRNDLAREALVGGIPVHRLDVLPRQGDAFAAVAARARRGEALDKEDERTFFGQMLRCPTLSELLEQRREDFDSFLLPHYMFATTVEAFRVVGQKAVLMPFLHDEGYARLAGYREMFRGARGALFMSAPEAVLAQQLFGMEPERCAVVGTGVELPRAASRFAFTRRHGPGPYLLYVGRKDPGKNLQQLLEWFRVVRPRFPGLRLMTIGAGAVDIQRSDGQSICDLGVVSEREKLDALSGALAVVQPSLLESFSLSLMEGWSVGRPAIVHGDCAVTSDHVARASGGFAVRSADGFGDAVGQLLASPTLAARLGRQGRAYVERELSWETVMTRTIDALERFRDPFGAARTAA